MGPPVPMTCAGCFACARMASGDAAVAMTSSASVLRMFFIFTGFGLGGLRDAGVHEAHGHRPFAHGRCASLHGATTNIACGEHSRKARLEKKWSASRRAPPLRLDSFAWKRIAGEDEALLVERHAAAQPARVRVRAAEEKQRGGIDPLLVSVLER